MTLTPLQQQAVEAVRAMDAAHRRCEAVTHPTDIAAQDYIRAWDKAATASIAAIRELADNEGKGNG